MNIREFIFDRRFSLTVWFHGLMCLSMTVIVLMLLGILWGISDSMGQFWNTIQSEINRMMLFAFVLTALLNGPSLLRFNAIARYLSTLPNNSFSSFKEMRHQAQEVEHLAKYRYSFLIFFLIFAGFCIGYFIGGNERQAALQVPVKIALSVSIAIAIASFFRIVIEIALMSTRYFIQQN